MKCYGTGRISIAEKFKGFHYPRWDLGKLQYVDLQANNTVIHLSQ